MLTTPNYGLEYAEGTDPAKNYPAVVDGPSKSKIDTALKANADALVKLGLSGKRLVIASATATVSPGSGGATIIFPAGSFTAVPVVVPVVGDEYASTFAYVQLVFGSTTATSFGVRVYKHDGTVALTGGTIRINYTAVGPSAATAELLPAPDEEVQP